MYIIYIAYMKYVGMAEGREKLQVKEFLIVGVWEWKS